jgi:hypothetical protein
MIQDVHEKLCPGLPRTKEAFGNKKNLLDFKEESFHQQIGLKVREELVKYYMWNIALYGAAA